MIDFDDLPINFTHAGGIDDDHDEDDNDHDDDDDDDVDDDDNYDNYDDDDDVDDYHLTAWWCLKTIGDSSDIEGQASTLTEVTWPKSYESPVKLLSHGELGISLHTSLSI